MTATLQEQTVRPEADMTDISEPSPQPTPAPTPTQPPRASWTITVLMLLGATITILGVVCLLMGLGGSTALDLKIGETTFKTTSVAIVITAVGLVMTLGPLKLIPEGVTPFGAMFGRFTQFGA
ncbi:hypothetical protein CFI00_10465 [Nocardioides sp. S5]|uniref:hypothetical protein n=1 Tax=Nocardioides sp. S5 TaxID=2017486 RepID=UPI001A8E05A4|nr:hypothetical protein [Nocardioides sp. S5]QSR30910.1 hypothetical protein CFI00_10465 [Nocardioides sp. S5]